MNQLLNRNWQFIASGNGLDDDVILRYSGRDEAFHSSGYKRIDNFCVPTSMYNGNAETGTCPWSTESVSELR